MSKPALDSFPARYQAQIVAQLHATPKPKTVQLEQAEYFRPCVVFLVTGEPKGQPRPRAFARKMGNKYVARVFDCGTAEGWKSQVALAAMPNKPDAPFDGPVGVSLAFTFARPKSHLLRGAVRETAPKCHTSKPDADNLAKAVLDALTALGAFWRDDSQVSRLTVSKHYGPTAGCLVRISEEVAL